MNESYMRATKAKDEKQHEKLGMVPKYTIVTLFHQKIFFSKMLPSRKQWQAFHIFSYSWTTHD